MRTTRPAKEHIHSKLPVRNLESARQVPSLRISSRTQYRADPKRPEIIMILGEPFVLSTLDGEKVLKHSRWSLMGTGKTIAKAHASLFEEAAHISDNYCSKPDAMLDNNALELKYFLNRLLA